MSEQHPTESDMFGVEPPVCQCPICFEAAYCMHDYIDCEHCGHVVYDELTDTYYKDTSR